MKSNEKIIKIALAPLTPHCYLTMLRYLHIDPKRIDTTRRRVKLKAKTRREKNDYSIHLKRKLDR